MFRRGIAKADHIRINGRTVIPSVLPNDKEIAALQHKLIGIWRNAQAVEETFCGISYQNETIIYLAFGCDIFQLCFY